jgi:siroheme synthase
VQLKGGDPLVFAAAGGGPPGTACFAVAITAAPAAAAAGIPHHRGAASGVRFVTDTAARTASGPELASLADPDTTLVAHGRGLAGRTRA